LFFFSFAVVSREIPWHFQVGWNFVGKPG
jgi:hypothetical protein